MTQLLKGMDENSCVIEESRCSTIRPDRQQKKSLLKIFAPVNEQSHACRQSRDNGLLARFI